MSLHLILKSLLQALWREFNLNSTIMNYFFFPISNSYWVRSVSIYMMMLIFLYFSSPTQKKIWKKLISNACLILKEKMK